MVPDFEKDASISQRQGKKNTNATAANMIYVMVLRYSNNCYQLTGYTAS